MFEQKSGRSENWVTMQDVAEQCEVSTATVSLVLSGDKRISPPTRKRVLAAVKQLGYRPHAAARSLALRSTRTIGLVLPEIEHYQQMSLFGFAIWGIYEAATQAGYRLLLEMATPQFLARRFYLRLLKEQSVDGMLYLTPSLGDTYLEEVVAYGFPFIQLGSAIENPQLSCVVGDDVAGGEMATRHLIENGHRQIGMISGSASLTMFRDRARGFKETLKKNNLQFTPDFYAETDFNPVNSEKAAYEIFQKGATAIVCANDMMAAGALRAAKSLGRRVPEDVSVVGMDDLPIASLLDTPLTTVRSNFKNLSVHAVEKLVEMIENRGSNHVREVLPMELTVRSSTGPAPTPPDAA